MPLFGKRPAPQSDAEREAAAVDLERIGQGGIPLGAEQRLKRLADPANGTPVFNSDLSAKEYAIALQSGLQPLAQVMGSSVVQQGWNNMTFPYWTGGIQEMPGFAEPWNLSRDLAFDRMEQEAMFAGADAVIGIEIRTGPAFEDEDNVEFMVFGTAVRETTLPRTARDRGGRPALSTLSAQDVDKLRRIGAESIGVIGHTAVEAVALDPMSGQQTLSWYSANQEITPVTEGVYDVRRRAMHHVTRQAREIGANDMVISTLRHEIRHHEQDSQYGKMHIFIISMQVLGTAIRLGAHDPHPSPLGVPMMSINLSDR